MSRHRIGDYVTAAVSLLALVLVGAYLATPTRLALGLEIREGSAAQVPKGRTVIFGSVTDAQGEGVKGARIELSHKKGGRRVKDLAMSSGSDGTFRKASKLKRGTYALEVSMKSGGKKVTARKTLKLQPGRAYSVDVQKKARGGLTLIPVRAY